MRRVVALVAVAIALAATSPAAAAQVGERIRAYDVVLDIQPNGEVLVEEKIRYDFGSNERHGIFREIPVRFDYPQDDKYERLTTIEQFRVSGPPGTPTDLKEESQGRLQRYRIGDPDRTITGEHDYTITYRVRGAMDAFSEHDELKWDAVGTGWTTTIDRATVQVRTPGPVTQVACFAGPEGSALACDSAVAVPPGATFAHERLAAREGLTVVIGLPKGTVTVPPPILDEKWAFSRAFAVNPATVAVSGGLLAAIVLGLTRVFRVGRDRRWRGSPVDVAFGNVTGQEEHVPYFEDHHDPVEFEPPDKIRPAQAGTLIDESADSLDVTATVVDLAVRGYLRIEEIPKKGLFGKPDWTLTKLRDSEGLLPYEAKLLDGLFESAGDDEVRLSELKQKFATRMKGIVNALYDDVVRAGWFPGRPDKVRVKWWVIGCLAFVLAVVVTIVLAVATHWGLLGIPLIVGGLGLMGFATKAPRRTAKGWAMLRRVTGFRRFIVESEKERARFAERANLFSEYLPYAVVFRCTDKWAKAFSGLDAEVAAATSGWYVSSHPFALGSFADSMDGFAVTTAGTIVASAPSSSSGFSGGGFSGGGFGGGGGGSW